ncbi:MAG: GHMP kinase [Moorellaceae bacterium]
MVTFLMRATVRVPGSCGELVQGMVDGSYFLITCPINITSEVTVTLEEEEGIRGPAGRFKALEAVRQTFRLLGLKLGARVEINSALPIGKGLASSTADVAGAAAAAALAAGRILSEKELIEIAVGVEPSDGIFLPGITLLEHLTGRRWEYLGEPPLLDILIIDLGGTVDTIAFNRRPDLMRLNRAKEALVRQAVKLVREGLARGEAALVAQGATVSALANQVILPKPELDFIIEIAQSCGALGVNVAHSGTAVGVLYKPEETDRERIQARLKEKYPYVTLIPAQIRGGGVEIVEPYRCVSRR